MSFDLIPYLGLTAAADVNSDRQVQASAYAELRKVAKPQQWTDLTEHDAYVRQMKDDPSLFSRDLGDYRMKWGYIGLARGLTQWMSPYAALRFTTLLSLFGVLAATTYLLWSEEALQGLFLIAPALMAGEFHYDLASTTPDLLALALAALLLLGWLRQSGWLIVLSSACAVSVRPDTIFVIGGIFAASLLFARARIMATIALGSSLIVFVSARFATSYAGWWQHVGVNLYGATAVMTGPPPFSLIRYIAALCWQLATIAATGTYLYVILLSLMTYAGLSKRSTPQNRVHDILFYGSVIGLIGRMILFPTAEPRFFLPTLFILSVLTVIRLRPDFSEGILLASGALRRLRLAWTKQDSVRR